MRPTLRALLEEGTSLFRNGGIEPARLEAEILLCRVVGCERLDLLLRRDTSPREEQTRSYRACLERRLGGEPSAYITGEKEFWSRPFWVNPAVLIPRPDTEVLVAEVLAAMDEIGPSGLAADVGTGSGNVVVTLAAERPGWRFLGIDLSAAALEVARRNAARHRAEGRIDWVQGDLTACLRPGSRAVDLLVSNPPYVEEVHLAGIDPAVGPAIDPAVRDFEPRVALAGGPGGLCVVFRLLVDAARVVRQGGSVLVEIGADQGERVLAWLGRSEVYGRARIVRDPAGRDRVVRADLLWRVPEGGGRPSSHWY